MRMKLSLIVLLALLAVASAACGSFAEPVAGSATLTHEADVVQAGQDDAHQTEESHAEETQTEEVAAVPTEVVVLPTETPIPPTEAPTAIPATEIPPTEVVESAPAYEMSADEENIVFFIQEFSDPSNGQLIFEAQQDVPMADGLIGFWACATCHSATSDDTLTGPGLKTLATRESTRIPGMPIELYTYYSIVNPNNYVVEGFDPDVMPTGWADVLNEQQIYDVAAYVLSLNGQ